MKKIILATSNPHKLKEIEEINNFEDISFDIVKGDFAPVEDGNNFYENAAIKAKSAAEIMNTYCLADDSGLCVDYLDGRPGIHSARYASTQQEKIGKLLNELEDAEPNNRTAHFTCSMVLVDSKGNILHACEGRVDGFIAKEAKGTNGFGYDPIFYVPEYSKTIAELPETVKNTISHRANALIPMLRWINDNIR